LQSILSIVFLFFFSFQGCSTTQIKLRSGEQQAKVSTLTASHNTRNKEIQNNTEEFDDEFEEEFEAKETIDEYDPISGYNRSMTSFNDKVIIYVLDPVSKSYAAVVSQTLRVNISNFVHNLEFPIRLVNNILQMKFHNSYDEIESFLVNSTVGLAGFMDPATKYLKIPRHNEDFGQIVADLLYVVKVHIVLPFLGPSNIRDLVGMTLDAYVSPLVNLKGWENYKIPDNFGQSTVIFTASFINNDSLHLGEYESIKKDAIDLYPFLKDIYEQKRVFDIAE